MLQVRNGEKRRSVGSTAAAEGHGRLQQVFCGRERDELGSWVWGRRVVKVFS